MIRYSIFRLLFSSPFLCHRIDYIACGIVLLVCPSVCLPCVEVLKIIEVFTYEHLSIPPCVYFSTSCHE